MSNETYLVVSYLAAGLFCLLLGLAACLWLRRPVNGIADALPQKRWGNLLRRTFPLSLILFVLASFFSVSYYGGCNPRPYEKIVGDRAYLMKVNQEQLSKSLDSITIGVFLWGAIVLLSVVAFRRGQIRSKKDDLGEGLTTKHPS